MNQQPLPEQVHFVNSSFPQHKTALNLYCRPAFILLNQNCKTFFPVLTPIISHFIQVHRENSYQYLQHTYLR